MIADVDKDGSGAIDYDEFEHMMTAKIGERDTKEELMKAFHIIDQDKNVKFFTAIIHLYCFLILIANLLSTQGKISASDIKRIAKELGQNFTDREIQEMVDEADQNSKWQQSYSILAKFLISQQNFYFSVLT